jgi:phosphoribosylaminoimidazole (AIR) synthetase
VRELRQHADVRALAHVTGGGLLDNVPRVLPDGLAVDIDRSTWRLPDLFQALQNTGGILPDEMWRTFNMGIGMVALVAAGDVEKVPDMVAGIPVLEIGRVVPHAGGERVLLR